MKALCDRSSPDRLKAREPSIRFPDPPHFHSMQVTEEDGGKLNAFAREPRMVVMEKGEASGPSRLLLIGGVALVVVLVAVAAGIS